MSERLNEQNFTKLYADKMACDGMCSSHRKQPEKGGQKKGKEEVKGKRREMEEFCTVVIFPQVSQRLL